MAIRSDPLIPIDNKQLRFYQRDGKYTRLSVEEAIANNLNQWEGWNCSAGARGLYIDYDGNVWVANCASARRNEHSHQAIWQKFIDQQWAKKRMETFGPWPHIPWYDEHYEELVKDIPEDERPPAKEYLMKELERQEKEFFETAHLDGELYKAFNKQGGFSWFSKERDRKDTWGLLGSIFEGWEIPETWVKCPFSSCGCGADVILSKAKDYSAVRNLAVTRFDYKGQFDTRTHHLDQLSEDPVGVEMNFPIPHQVLWDISRKCNFNCSYCWPAVHNNTDKHYDYDVIIETIDRAIDEWAEGDSIRWNFGGGEPTLHPKFMDIIKYLKSRNQWTMITTNGSRTTRYWREACKYLNTINFSCHFESIDIDLFIENIKAVAEYHDQVDDDHWLEVKLMTPPGVVGQGMEVKERLEKLDVLMRPGANGRPKGAITLVPIRDIIKSGEVVKYSDNELGMLKNQ